MPNVIDMSECPHSSLTTFGFKHQFRRRLAQIVKTNLCDENFAPDNPSPALLARIVLHTAIMNLQKGSAYERFPARRRFPILANSPGRCFHASFSHNWTIYPCSSPTATFACITTIRKASGIEYGHRFCGRNSHHPLYRDRTPGSSHLSWEFDP